MMKKKIMRMWQGKPLKSLELIIKNHDDENDISRFILA